MKFEKQYLANMTHCYATLGISCQGRDKYLFAPDDVGPCIAIDAKSGEIETVWEGPGGTMSIIPLPGREGDLLVSQNFLPDFHALAARIVRMRRTENDWHVEPWLELPYVHRFDVIEADGKMWFLGCIASGTTNITADWQNPGSIVIGEMGADMQPPATLRRIGGDMHRNHGYFRKEIDGATWILVTCDEGVFRVSPPTKTSDWRVERIIDCPASDVSVCDLDSDGIVEMIVISPFHGDQVIIYHASDSGYKEVCRASHSSSFLHAIWTGDAGDRAIALIGGRGGEKELMAIYCEHGAYQTEVIEKGYGASNICAYKNQLLVANREVGECALFIPRVD